MHPVSRDRLAFLAVFVLTLPLYSIGCEDSCKPVPVAQRIFHVSPDGAGQFSTIAAAIAASTDGDIVELEDGTYRGEGNRDIDFLGKKITVRSKSGYPHSCTIDCEGTQDEFHRAFWFHLDEDQNSVLSGISIVNGTAENRGGGILCERGSSPVLRDLMVSGCRAGLRGGGIYCDEDSRAVIQDCTLLANRARGGGGVCCRYASSHVLRCQFEENRALYGGGAEVSSSGNPETTIEECTFDRNFGLSGGAMFFQNTQCRVINCQTRRNRGTFGGAFFCGTASPLIMGCTSYADSASAYGSSLRCREGSNPVLISCTFSYGYALDEGSVVSLADGCNPIFERCIISFCRGGRAFSPEGVGDIPLLRCCDLFGNESGDWTGLIADQATGGGNISADPLYCDPGAGNLQLRIASPCGGYSSACGSMGAWSVGCP
jgi:hypothetical protein